MTDSKTVSVSDILKKPNTCPCGQRLPWHIVKLTDKRFSHVCLCNRLYKWASKDTLLLVGEEKNPFTSGLTLDDASLGADDICVVCCHPYDEEELNEEGVCPGCSSVS